jgi:hypothetical protein
VGGGSPITRGYRAGQQRGAEAMTSIKSAGSRAVEAVGEHPVPAALIGVGLAWLLLENSATRPGPARILKRGREAVGGVGDTLANAAGGVRRSIAGAVGTAADTLAEGASSVGEYVSEAATAVGEATSSGYQKIGSLWERHPMAMSAAVLTTGIAAGLLLPATSREHDLMGDAATNVVKKVRNKSSELVERGSRLAATGAKVAATGVKAAAIVHKVKGIARSARKAVTG